MTGHDVLMAVTAIIVVVAIVFVFSGWGEW
jgi:hypothetical protein